MDGLWQTETVDTEGSAGTYSALTIDGSGHRHLAYYEGDQEALRYATTQQPPAAFEIEVVVEGELGSFCAVQTGPSGMLEVAYYDDTHSNLVFARGYNSSWTHTVIDSIGDMGSHCDLSVEFTSRRKKFISYYDATNTNLMYAEWRPQQTAFTYSMVAPGDVGSYSSLASDQAGNLSVSYYADGSGDLHCASFIDSLWLDDTVDSFGNVGLFTSLTIDAIGGKHIAYYEADQGALKYAASDPLTDTPEAFQSTCLCEPFPNPFNPHISVPFFISNPTSVELSVYSITGRKIATVHSGILGRGYFTYIWDGHDTVGRKVASGVYFIVLRVPEESHSKKIVLLR